MDHEDRTIDAARMNALVGRGESGIAYNLKALPLAHNVKDPNARRRVAPLLNNPSRELRQLGRHEDALRCFRDAVSAYEARGNSGTIHVARWQVACTLRDLKGYDDALTILYRLERDSSHTPDGYVFEEIAKNLEALGRHTEAAPYFKHAFEVLSQDMAPAGDEPQRLARLREKAR